jgi:hypothetical protein
LLAVNTIGIAGTLYTNIRQFCVEKRRKVMKTIVKMSKTATFDERLFGLFLAKWNLL